MAANLNSQAEQPGFLRSLWRGSRNPLQRFENLWPGKLFVIAPLVRTFLKGQYDERKAFAGQGNMWTTVVLFEEFSIKCMEIAYNVKNEAEHDNERD